MRRSAYIQGAHAMLPIMMGVIPMSVVTGVAAINCGMTTTEALLSSVIMYAAAAQLVAYEMIGNGADAVLIFSAAIVLNLRFLLYSAGMAPYLQQAGLPKRLAGAYALSDQAYGITMVQLQKDPETDTTRFYLGAALFMWIVYQFAAAAGIFLGASISKDLSLDFAVPLTFSALVVPLLGNPQLRIAAITSAVMALCFADLPNNAGFFIAALSGITAGVLCKRHMDGKTNVGGARD